MRVISGTARRTTLETPVGQHTRPTSDMAKEGLFNILAAEIPCANFLDLFSGSGAIGIEALSRGAKHAVFVDNSKTAIAATKINLTKTGLCEQALVIEATASQAIDRLTTAGELFDIIFLDPPYDTILLSQTLPKLANILVKSGIIVAETDGDFGKTPDGLVLTDTRRYGRTSFLFFTKAVGV